MLNPDFLFQVIKDYLQFAPQTVSIKWCLVIPLDQIYSYGSLN